MPCREKVSVRIIKYTFQILVMLQLVGQIKDASCELVCIVRERKRPGVRAEANQCSMIQLHVGSKTLVFPVQEVFGAPDADCAVVSAGRQVLPIAAEIDARHIPTVAL